MKNIIFLFVVLFSSSCLAQKPLLVEQTLIKDFSTNKFGVRLFDTEGELKPTVKFMNNIDMYQITYLSDGLQIKGYLANPKQKGFTLVSFLTEVEIKISEP